MKNAHCEKAYCISMPFIYGHFLKNVKEMCILLSKHFKSAKILKIQIIYVYRRFNDENIHQKTIRIDLYRTYGGDSSALPCDK